jgi:2-iminobutanoate/2-iminopropanoate deaminase
MVLVTRQIISTSDAPAAIGPYSQAVVANGFVFCSGQIALDPATKEVVAGDVQVQTERVLQNIGGLLRAAGAGYADVVKATVFLHTMDDFAAMNEVYTKYFGDQPPARTTVGNLNLPRGVLVEIEVIAALP